MGWVGRVRRRVALGGGAVAALAMAGPGASAQIVSVPMFGAPIEVSVAEASRQARAESGQRRDFEQPDAAPAPRPFAPVRVRRVCSLNGGSLAIREPGTFIVKGPVYDPAHRVVDHRLLSSYDPETWAAEPVETPEIDPVEAATAEVVDLLGRGRRQRALRRAEDALRDAPEASMLWRGYAALLLSTGRTDDAVRRLHEVYIVDPTLALEPMDVSVWFGGGVAEVARRAQVVGRYAERKDTPEGWVGAAVVWQWAGDADAARAAIERARNAGADAMLCDRLVWGVEASERGGADG